MAVKVQEAEQKKGSKARNREGEKEQWWPCEVKDSELRDLQNEGMISPHWSFMKDSVTPKPDPDECILTKAWVERGLSLPCCEFFLFILTTFGLQPHNICPNSYLLLSNFVTLCKGHLGICPDIRLWQFFIHVKKETKDKAMVNYGSMTFMLRPGRMYPPHSSHESVRYWNAGWFYVKNIPVPNVHEGLPKFVNKPPEELDSWSLIPALAQYPELDKAARRISWLVHDGLTGTDLTLSWFSRRIQPLKYNPRLICEYTGVEDQLRVTRDNLPADSLKRRIKTLVKITRGQPVPEIVKNIKTNNQCPSSCTPSTYSAEGAEEDPEDDDEEEEQAPKKAAPRPAKRPLSKVSGSEAGASGEASAKKAKNKPPPLDSKKAERERLKLLANAGKGSHPLIPGATSQKAPASRVNTQTQTTNRALPRSSCPSSTEIIPMSSERGGGSSSAARRAAPEGPRDKAPEEAEVNSQDKAEAPANDAVTFPANFGDPTNLYSTPKAYSHKFFHKLTEAEKWDLEKDLLNSMMSNAWGKEDVESSEIQLHKKEINDFFDHLLVKRKELQALHYELNNNISLQRRVTLSQAEDIQAGRERIAELEQNLAEAQGAYSSLATTSSELESLRSAYQDLETKFVETDKKRERAEKQLAEKKSELLQKEADFVLKRKVDSDTLQKLQNEVQRLRNYMTTTKKGWDLLNADVMEPLGYDEERRNQFPRDDLIQLAGDDCKDLISASRKICHNLNIKESRTCDVRVLINRMDLLPELVADLQASSARGAAQMSLAMCLARSPGLDIDLATTGVPPNTDVDALLDACRGYDTRITRRIRHDQFFDKVVLPADEVLEAEYAKERAAEAQPARSGDEGQVTWTSSKDKSKDGATSPTEEVEDEDEDDVSSPAKEAEDEAAHTEDGACSSPAKEN
ncbi:hypothetical protein QYE76_064820 [Lolium multiflorum]|uniref:Transposase (putative) gypsy type domain-containing protein n=1 Tax=Lolium multiflorum TaxID=4521 RepID=A0AAD8W9G2_LOLMU|nr:hypothetical protein QYE76_064820 [Lolium multiflorum]